MNMSEQSAKNAESKYVHAIPISVDRTEIAYNGKAITEQNLTKLLKMFVGVDIQGFVISEEKTNSQRKSLEFMLGGYYFKLLDTNILNTSGSLYVYLSFDPSSEELYLQGDSVVSATELEEPSVYYGLTFTTEAPNEDLDTPYLQLLKEGVVPAESYYKFQARDIRDICGGTI